MKLSLLKLVTIFSVAAVLGFTNIASAATLSVNVSQDNFKIGDQFDADVKVNSEDVGINAAQATIKFSTAVLQAVSIDKTGSVFNFWLQDPKIDNEAGEITFIGGSSSGLVGKSLQTIRIVFKATGIGQSDFVFTDGSVNASDGSGTNVLSKMNKTTVIVGSTVATSGTQVQTIERTPITSDTVPTKPNVTVPLYPVAAGWYNNSSRFTASWSLPNDIDAVATSLNKNPWFDPTSSQGIYSNETFSALTDGVWYLHVRFHNNIGWSETNHYRLAIDTVPPAPFEITFSDGSISDNPTPVVNYQAKDQLSGTDHYYIKIDSNEAVDTTSRSYTLPAQKPGKHLIKVGAEDKAGNKVETSADFEIIAILSPKILSTSTDVYVGEGGLFINGSSIPNSSVIVEVVDSNSNLIYTFATASDENGIWALKIDSPLKKDTYYILATAQDSRGATSLSVKSNLVNVKDRPIFTVFGIGITGTQLAIILLIVLIGSYIIGWYSNKLISQQRNRRILISERDVTASFNVLKRDIEQAIANWDDRKIENHELTQIEFLLKHINENIEKLQKYIISGIKDIGKK